MSRAWGFPLICAVGLAGAVLIASGRAGDAQEPTRPRPALGVTLSQSSRGGVRIVSVYAGSPAADARLKPGDQILAVNDEPVERIADVIRLIGKGEIERRIAVAVRRGNLEGTVYPKLRDAREVFASQPAYTPPASSAPASPRSEAEGMPYQS